MSSRTTRLASGLTWTLVTKFALGKPRAAAAAGDGTTASRTASATSARAIPSAPERDAGRLPLSGAVELEVSPRVELEEGRDEVRREGLHRGVEVAHDRVVVAARVLDRLLQLAERPLELDEVRVRLEVRIRLGERHELAEGARERVLRLRARLRRLRGDRGAARTGHGLERGPLVGGVALHRLDEVRHEVGAPLELDVDVRPRLVGPHAQPDEPVVAGDDQRHEPGDYEEKDHPARSHRSPPRVS